MAWLSRLRTHHLGCGMGCNQPFTVLLTKEGSAASLAPPAPAPPLYQ
jgi:hypothetical protein